MIPHTVRSLGNGITEIVGSTDIAVNAIVFVKRNGIAAVEYRKRFREIRVDILGKDVPILLKFLLDEEGDTLLNGLLDCMKDVPEGVEKDLEQMKAKEAISRTKMDAIRQQMVELRELLEQSLVARAEAAAADAVARDAEREQQAAEVALRDAEKEVEAAEAAAARDAALTELSEYETLSECEDEKEAELANFGDCVILFIVMLLICIFMSSFFVNISKLTRV